MDKMVSEWDRDIEKRVMRMIRSLLPLAIHFVNNHPSGVHQVQPFPVFGDLSSLSSSSSSASELYEVVHRKLHELLEWQREQKVGEEVVKERDDLLAAMRSAQWITPVIVEDSAAAAHVVPQPDARSDYSYGQLCIHLAVALPCLFLIALVISGLGCFR
ncbi:hypothetical protein CBR_g51665 [Chara braunii]|uniref:Uncharacterized protein n=1 Tax=Chara braunii TaxID=69332 RepID=A0A388M8U1_CHABU|nr:hypothetical protein CBR_g51665 [Chara braunii]|eukprot:GBG91007.1 hypothetical protein CBR_g51665 [Chara braunii]